MTGTNKVKCDDCSPGYFSSTDGASACDSCGKGTYNAEVGASSATQCRDCPKGKYSSASAVVNEKDCSNCIPGMFGKVSGAGSSKLGCTSCPEGWFQDSPGNTTCVKVEQGKVVAKGGGASIQVPLGSKICDNGIGCTDKEAPFEACTTGFYGKDPPTYQCLECPAGFSSSKAAIECQPWYVF